MTGGSGGVKWCGVLWNIVMLIMLMLKGWLACVVQSLGSEAKQNLVDLVRSPC